MPRFHITYERITPESAEHGDYDDIGFVIPSGWTFSTAEVWGEEAKTLQAECDLTLRQALRLFGRAHSPHCLEDHDGSWLDLANLGSPYGAEEVRWTLHAPDNATPATLNRIYKLLTT